jgi:hypothetical protein
MLPNDSTKRKEGYASDFLARSAALRVGLRRKEGEFGQIFSRP